MASIESKLFYLLLRLINKKKFLDMQFAFGKFDFNNSRLPPKRTEKVCNVSTYTANGRNVFVLSPKSGKATQHILYLHGGAYVQNFVKQHWKFLSNLVASTDSVITAPDYPLAPKHTFIDAFQMVITVYREMAANVGSHNIVIMGDSAGGGFSLSLCQRLKDENLPQPRRIILLSPWLDLTLSNPDVRSIDSRDPFLGISGLRKAARAYAGGYDLNDYRLSPINGSLEGLAPISIFIGSNDILVADARKLRMIAKQRGIEIDYHEYSGMVHVWMLLYFPESRHAQEKIEQLIVDLLQRSTTEI
jgi:epsilon-lactone hydrolase